ncbi:MAG: DUF4197 domain-containing protein [Candidatus Krumholzibacteriota bacterium]|nr:DUF4197 domain-containing protein [Candidatus Krumholzibacteriota bacterium]
MDSLRRICLILILALSICTVGCKALQEDLSEILNTGPGEGGALDEPTVIAGIKEALKVGTGEAVFSTSSVDGFLGNQLIRILIPEQLESMAETLRKIGLGSEVDKLEIGMNRAAELAAGEARGIFWNAITSMTVSDAFGILKGHDTAATEYFRGMTAAELQERFHPIIEKKIEEVGLSRVYGTLADRYNSLPIADKDRLIDLDEYVTDRALTGLFTVLAQEEVKIRKDPLARTTDLLRRVFGS